MAASKSPTKKRKIPPSDVEVGNRTLEAVLADLAEVVKESAARSAHAEEVVAEAAKRSARAEEVAAEAAKRSARAEEMSQLALQSIGALLQDLRALAERTDDRIGALEKIAAE